MRCKLLLLLIVILSSACEKDPAKLRPDDFGPPVIKVHVSPQLADSTTWFEFSAAGSHDADGMWGIIEFRWDLNDDGVWDTPFWNQEKWVSTFPNPGIHKVKLEVRDRYGQISIDSVELETYGAITDTSHFTDERDGQVYKTVRIGGITWMAENLNFGQMIPVTDSVIDNGKAEKYCYQDDPDLSGELGGHVTYYHFMEMMNHDTTTISGICPPGWELPTREDWRLITDLGRRPIAFFTTGGFSNLNLTRIGMQAYKQEWDPIDLNMRIGEWFYFTRDFYMGYLNGPNKILPFMVSSQNLPHRGRIYPIQYVNDSIRKYMGIAPVRCIKRD